MNIKKLRELKKNKKGFTLIEIIVVVVILAVLLAVAVPSVLNYLNEADDAKYNAQARAVMTTTEAQMIKAYTSGSIVDATEAGTLLGEGAGSIKQMMADDKVDISDVKVFIGATVTQTGDKIAIKDAVEIPTGGLAKNVQPNIVAVSMKLSGKKIAVAVLNDKIYMTDDKNGNLTITNASVTPPNNG